MVIGLVDSEDTGFPNLALMKISQHHKDRGHLIEFVDSTKLYDIIYISKVFTHTEDISKQYDSKCDLLIKGGTGYDMTKTLPEEIENTYPDYFLYPINKKYDCSTSYGFLTRGCIRKCKWCIVPIKEGMTYPYWDIQEVLGTNNKAVLMDNNVLSIDYGIKQIEKIVKLKCKVDFNQGLDARIIAKDKSLQKLLSNVKWINNCIRLACDSDSMFLHVSKSVKGLKDAGFNISNIMVYVLLTEFNSSYERIIKLKELGVKPFAQPYLDLCNRTIVPQWQKDLARYTNMRAIFNSCSFSEYEPRKGFKCEKHIRGNNYDNYLLYS